MDAASKYRISVAPAPAGTSELQSVASPSASAARASSLLDPHNPLLIFGVLLGATFGLMAFSTSVRVGAARASVAVGTT